MVLEIHPIPTGGSEAMGSIAAIIEHFKTHWEKPFEPQLVERICAEVGHQWRERCLTPWLTLGAFLLQILHGNTACAHVPHLTGQRFSATAYCQARKRLPLEVLERLLSHVAAMFRAATAGVERWRGHRVWVVDGSESEKVESEKVSGAVPGSKGSDLRGRVSLMAKATPPSPLLAFEENPRMDTNTRG
jgi:hypothetical protein